MPNPTKVDVVAMFFTELALTTAHLRSHPERHEYKQVPVVTYYVAQVSCTGGWSVLRKALVSMQLCVIPDTELWVSPATDEIIECRREGDFVGITVETFTVADIVWCIYASGDQTKMMYDLDALIAGLRRLRSTD